MRWAEGEAVSARQRERSAVFKTASGLPRNLLDSVRRRLILVVLLAIAPIATVLIIQGILQLMRAEDEARNGILSRANAAVASQQSIIASAENVLYALASVPDIRAGDGNCQATLYGATLSLPFVSNVAVLDPSGRVTCSAISPVGTDVSARRWWAEAQREPGFSVSERLISPITSSPVLIGSLSFRNPTGTFGGAVALSLDAIHLDNLLRQKTPPSEAIVALFSEEGAELVSNSHAMSEALFTREDIIQDVGNLREAKAADGTSWTYTVIPVGREGLRLAFAQPSGTLFRWTALSIAVSFVLPAVIVVFTLISIWLAVDRIVLQWLLYIRRVTAVYAQGHYGFRPSRMDQAPSEFRVLGAAIEEMALAVRERDGQLRQALAEKTALIREIHHRVKNSLQVVVSLLSLYGSGVPQGEGRQRFEQLRMRVNTLAMVHRLLFEANEGSEVRLSELLNELAALVEGVSDKGLKVEVDCRESTLPVDHAVPLALLVVELVSSLTPADLLQPRVSLRCEVDDGEVSVIIRTPGSIGARLADDQAGLAHGFARQLGGSLEIEEDGPEYSSVRVIFDARHRMRGRASS